MTDKYATDVVNPGDAASRLAHQVCINSFGNSPAVTVIPLQPGNFRGPVGFLWAPGVAEKLARSSSRNPDRWVMMQCKENDGAGGKPQFFTLVSEPEHFQSLGWEIITMVADDFARTGRLPVVFDNEVQVQQVTNENWHLFEAMMQGYGSALRKSGLVNITGETAIMRHSITAFCDDGREGDLILTWGASGVGLAHYDLYFDGSSIVPGMDVLGFWEHSYRCNGGTFFTDLLMHYCGGDIRKLRRSSDLMGFVKKLVVPSQSYAHAVSTMVGWNPDGGVKPIEDRVPFAGIAHITGGGVWHKFGEILPEGVGVVLDRMPNPAPVLRQAQEMSWDIPGLRLTDRQAYGTLHGGCGMLLVLDPKYSAAVKSMANKFGIRAEVVGRTVESAKNEIVIHSQFREEAVLSSLDD